MDRIQDKLDPEVAAEVILLLNKKVANLRGENAELQNQLSKSVVKAEEKAQRALNVDNTRNLLEEIESLKSELERRHSPEEVASLEGRLHETKRSKRELEAQATFLKAKLEESESGKETLVATKQTLQEEIQKLCCALNERTQEKERAVAKLKSSTDVFDFSKFLGGGLVKLPQRHPPELMTADETRRLRDMVLQRGEEFLSINAPHGILWASEGGGCVMPLPSIFCNGRTSITEKMRRKTSVNQAYQFCGVDGRNHHRTYHGVYRCIAMVTTEWQCLARINEEFAERFLERVVVEKSFAPMMFVQFVEQLYRMGALKVECAVLIYERFDDATVRKVRSTGQSSTFVKAPSFHAGVKRPGEQFQEWAGDSAKKPKFKN